MSGQNARSLARNCKIHQDAPGMLEIVPQQSGDPHTGIVPVLLPVDSDISTSACAANKSPLLLACQ